MVGSPARQSTVRSRQRTAAKSPRSTRARIAARSGANARSRSQNAHVGADQRHRRRRAAATSRAAGAARRPARRRAARSRRCARCSPAIGVSRRAAKVAMLTWSSWFADVGSESTDAGCASDLFSEASAAAVTCAIMKPELTPPSSTRNGGRPDRFVSISSAMRRSDSAPISAIASARLSAANATGSAWKLPPERISPVVREDERIVGHRVRFGQQHRRRVPHLVEARAHHLRLAAQAVRILHARAILVRRADRAAGEQRRGRSPRRRAWPRWPRTAWMRASNGVSLPRHASTDSAPATNAAASARSAANSPASASAVDTCVPLSSASPSFGPSVDRREAGRARARRAPA